MRSPSSSTEPQSSFFDILSPLDPSHPLLALAETLGWGLPQFAPLYKDNGRAAKPIRLICGLLMLKQLYNLSDQVVVDQWLMNPC